jgi:hypothetical protein
MPDDRTGRVHGKAGDDRAPTTDQIRSAIDAGKAGDKRAFPDPAAAPLGTDAEAGGAAPSAAERRTAWQAEIEDRPDDPQPSQDRHVPEWTDTSDSTRWNGPVWLAIAGLVILAVVAIAAMR